MRVVIAFDKWKGCLTAQEACLAAARGVLQAHPEAVIDLLPIADGGEGTVAAVASHAQGMLRQCQVWNAPRTRLVEASWFQLDSEAVLEMAAASGLAQLAKTERDPLRSTTFGTGQMLLAALDHGARRLCIGLGGSATNDGGLGVAQAFGFRLIDRLGRDVRELPEGLLKVVEIVPPKRLPEMEIVALADVTNPLLGPGGATLVYGPQKGVTESMAPILEDALDHLANLTQRWLGRDARDTPGAGAAGGCAFGLITFLNARLESGFDYLAQLFEMEKRIVSADLVMTGEGKLDFQTLQGKAPSGVATLARKHQTAIGAIGGTLEESARTALEATFDDMIILTDSHSAQESLLHAETHLSTAAKALVSKAFP